MILSQLRYCPFQLDIWIPRELYGAVDGACGHFNYNDTDDLTTPAGDVLPLDNFPYDFLDEHWRVRRFSRLQCSDDLVFAIVLRFPVLWLFQSVMFFEFLNCSCRRRNTKTSPLVRRNTSPHPRVTVPR